MTIESERVSPNSPPGRRDGDTEIVGKALDPKTGLRGGGNRWGDRIFGSLALAAGAASVSVAVTHALFGGDAEAQVRAAGVQAIWSTDCIAHPTNALSVAPLLAAAFSGRGR